MKLAKILLIVTCLLSVLIPSIAKNTQKASYETTSVTNLLADTSDYDDADYSDIIKPKSIQTTMAI